MASIASRKTKVGDLVVGEFNALDNYERTTMTLTVTTDMEIGTVFNAADGTVYVAADDGVVTEVVILVDDAFSEIVTADGDYTLAVLKGGPGGSGWAQINSGELKYGDTLTSGEQAAVEALIESQGIRVLKSAY